MKHLVVLTMVALLGVPAAAMAGATTTTGAKPAAVCKEDKQKFCKDAKKSGQKVRDCLLKHKDELSEGCKNFVDRPKKVRTGKGKGKGKKAGTEAGAKPAENGAAKPDAATTAPATGTAPPEAGTAAPDAGAAQPEGTPAETPKAE